MAYWRMQLHPCERTVAVHHTITSLAAGYIGLDFVTDIGDLRLLRKEQLPDGQHDYWDFGHVMRKDDVVLIITHHFPFALARIAGPYNYISRAQPHLGVWFRHFRRVRDVVYYADMVTNAHSWQQLKMTDTISPLHDRNAKSYKLIQRWTSFAW